MFNCYLKDQIKIKLKSRNREILFAYPLQIKGTEEITTAYRRVCLQPSVSEWQSAALHNVTLTYCPGSCNLKPDTPEFVTSEPETILPFSCVGAICPWLW